MSERQVMEEAIGWTIRLRHGGDSDWSEFTRWLESDPAHRPAYDQVAGLDFEIARLLPAGKAASIPSRAWRVPFVRTSRRTLIGTGAAAAMAAAIAFVMFPSGPAVTYVVETAAGERRSIALEGGTRIELNGLSRIRLDRANPRFASLERGEALFEVVHQRSNPFRVEAGQAVIRNVGTVFNVLHEGETVAVEVAQGAVIFSSDGDDLSLTAGVVAREESGRVTVGRRDPAEIGGWRHGQLVYSSASLADVARDLSRSSGVDIRASAAVAQRKFSGTILLEPDRDRMRRRLAALLDVDVRLAGQGWVLAPAD